MTTTPIDGGSARRCAGAAASGRPASSGVAEVVVVLALVIELVAMFGNVIARSFFDTSLLWSLEIGELSLVVMTFLGGAIAYPRNEHMALHVFVQRLPARWQSRVEALCHWQVFVMAAIGCVLAWQMMLSRWNESTPYLGLPASWFAAPMILGMALLAFFAGQRVRRCPWRQAVGAGDRDGRGSSSRPSPSPRSSAAKDAATRSRSASRSSRSSCCSACPSASPC